MAGAVPGLLAPARVNALAEAEAELEQHEFVQAMASYEKTGTGVVFHCTTSGRNTVDVALTVCMPEIVRVQMCADPELRKVKGLLEIKEDWGPCAFSVSDRPETLTVDTGALRIEFRKKPWKYAIYDKGGQLVVQEHVSDVDTQGNFRGLPLGFTTAGGRVHRCNETLALPADEGFYGLGERFTKLNKVGLRVNGWVVNPWGAGTDDTHKPIPFVMSTGGYGIFANTTFRNRWDIGSRSVVSHTFLIDDPRLDYFVIYGPSLKEILGRYGEITGQPAFPPKKSFGVWFVTNGPSETGETNPVAIAKKFRALDLPLDFFIALVGMESTDEQKGLALVKQLSQEMGKMGVKVGIHVSPFLRADSAMAQEGGARGYLLMQKDGSVYKEILLGGAHAENKIEESLEAVERDAAWRGRFYGANRGPAVFPDFSNPAAVKWWKDKLAAYMKAGCFGVGMSDFGEDNPAAAHYFNQRDGLEMHNLYTSLYQRATYEAVAENSEYRGLVNARSGTAGMQRFPVCWSGDPNCDWEEMASTLRAGLSIGLSGVPFWNSDVGGFNSAGGHDLSPELYIRWMQMNMFQSHVRFNGSPLRAPWNFGDQAVASYRKYSTLRYQLLPYIYSHAYNATKTSLPMIRAMALEFQEDPSTHNLQDQYIFGDAFLVAPVYKPVNARSVYLPAGKWYDYETGKEYSGPTTLQIEPPLDVLPLYVRENSIIPMGAFMNYVGEKPFDPITLHIRLTSEADFTLFDDDERARTEEIVKCHAIKKGSEISLQVGASAKAFVAKFNKTSRPRHVRLDGQDVAHLGSRKAFEEADRGWYIDASSAVYTKFKASGSAREIVLHL